MAHRAAFSSRWPLLGAIAVRLVAPAPLAAEQLPFRHYRVADGRVGSHVLAIYQDHHGYVWFAGDGLSRFDGYGFVNYDVRDGLGRSTVNDVREDAAGRLWVATNGAGVARLIEEPPAPGAKDHRAAATAAKFVSFPVGESRESNRVNAIAFDASGALWCLTDHGLYRGDPPTFEFEVVVPIKPLAAAMPLLIDSSGRVWAGMVEQLVLLEGGQRIRFGPSEPVAEHHVRAIVEDSRGRILAANHFGLFEYRPSVGASRGGWRRLPLRLGPLQEIRSMWAGEDGVLWIATTHGLIRYTGNGQSLYTTANGLENDYILTVTADRLGRLWLGTPIGPARVSPGIVSWTRADGLPDEFVNLVVEGNDGRLYASTHRGGFAEIVGPRAVPIAGSAEPPFNPVVDTKWTEPLQDPSGDWWVVTWTGLHLIKGPRLQFRAGRVLGPADGIREGTLFGGGNGNIHRSDGGTLWVGSQEGVYVHDPSRHGGPRFELLAFDGFNATDEVNGLVSDASGTLWLTTHLGIARVVGGRVERIDPIEGLQPHLRPRVLLRDRRGRIWVGLLNQGLIVTAEPGATRPRWRRLSTADGLPGDEVRALAEDESGRIWLGTTRGVACLDPETGSIRVLDSASGLAGDKVNHLHLDRSGLLWISTATGLTRFDPRLDRAAATAPSVYYSRIQVSGEDVWLPERGARAIPPLSLGPSRDTLLIEYVALPFETSRSLRYQYRLNGVDTDWGPASEQRSLNFARLAAGSYRLLVRAVTPDGLTSAEPASLPFTIAAPWWHRWWFFASIALLVGLAAESLHRLRLRRRLELEAIRTRIATDLHDDLGSSLSRIAILSEVARRDLDGGNAVVGEQLSHIASVSRELVDCVGEIVWTVHPERDRLPELARRMRRFAEDLLSTREVDLCFEGPSDGQAVTLAPEVRREVFLVFKEAVNNLARHSGCRAAVIELGLDDDWLTLRVNDDGRGFEPERAAGPGRGNGLSSMALRAAQLGGTLEVLSRVGEGTAVALRVPVRQGRRRGHRRRRKQVNT